MAFGIVFSGIKTSVSDLLVQKVVEQRKEVDWKRNAAFATFGFVYLGGIQYMIYVPGFSWLFPGAAGFAAKTLRDKLRDARGLFQVSFALFNNLLIWKFSYNSCFHRLSAGSSSLSRSMYSS